MFNPNKHFTIYMIVAVSLILAPTAVFLWVCDLIKGSSPIWFILFLLWYFGFTFWWQPKCTKAAWKIASWLAPERKPKIDPTDYYRRRSRAWKQTSVGLVGTSPQKLREYKKEFYESYDHSMRTFGRFP